MVELRAFGSLDLRDAGGAVLNALLTQPKRTALFVYLVLARPRGFHRRDKLLALFWPDLDESHARDALNQALRFLRRIVGNNVILSRGAEEVEVDAGRVSCDVYAFESHLDDGRHEDGLALYRGELLESFHPPASNELEQWLDVERTRLRMRAHKASTHLRDEAAARGELSLAITWARRASGFAPLEETDFRRLLELLGAAGDHGGASRAYQEFARRLEQELEVEPAPQTRALVAEIRKRPAPAVELPAGEHAERPRPDIPAGQLSEQMAGVLYYVMPYVKGESLRDRLQRERQLPVDEAVAVSDTTRAPVWRRGRLLGTVVAAAVVAGVAVAALMLPGRSRRAAVAGAGGTAGEYSVAVLYFENLSPDSADAYLADGLTEEIISRLGGVARLQVKRSSRDAVRRVRDTVPDYLVAVGRALSVRYLVEGSVRSAGGRVKVAVRLVTSADGFRVWGEEYERTTADLLALESELAGSVAAGITGRLTPSERASLGSQPTLNPQAYEHLLRGNYHLALRDRGFDRALAEYQEALRLDPGFSRAHARMALAYGGCSNWRYPCLGLGRDSLLARGLVAADNALRLDSTTADAWLALGLLRSEQHPLTLEGVREPIEQALRLEPQNADAHQLHGFTLLLLGQDSAATAAYHAALALQPDLVAALRQMSRLKRNQGRLVEALALMDSAVSVSPSLSGQLYALRSGIKRRLGDVAGARADAETALRVDGNESPLSRVELALLDLQAGDTVSARARVERFFRDAAGSGGALERPDGLGLAKGLAAVGDIERALQALERVRPLTAEFGFYLRDPDLDPLRSNPRFQRLVAASRPPR